MSREVIGKGRDVSAAFADGCAQLGVSKEEAGYTLICLAKKGFFKSTPAQVKVFIKEEEKDEVAKPITEPKAEVKAEPKAEVKAEPKAEVKAEPKTEVKPEPKAEVKAEPKTEVKDEAKPAPVVVQSKEKETATNATVSGDKNEGDFTASQSAKEKTDYSERFAPRPPEVEIEPDAAFVEKVTAGIDYIKTIIAAMDYVDVEYSATYYNESVTINLNGESMGAIIGRRGETLDCLQYLVSLIINRYDGDFIRVKLDTGNYREKREQALKDLARKVSNQVARTGKTIKLEPMNPYERRVIHGTITTISGVYSKSIGDEPMRRVIICADGKSGYNKGRGKYDSGKPRQRRDDYNPNYKSGGNGGNGGSDSSNTSANEPAAKHSAASLDAKLLESATLGVPIISGIKAEPKPAPTATEVKKETPSNPNEPQLYGKL